MDGAFGAVLEDGVGEAEGGGGDEFEGLYGGFVGLAVEGEGLRAVDVIFG
jgi:hypothetical protein